MDSLLDCFSAEFLQATTKPSYADPPKKICTASSAEKGRILLAAQDLQAGEEVLVENALFTCEDDSGSDPRKLAAAFRGIPVPNKLACLELHAPRDSWYYRNLQKDLQGLAAFLPEEEMDLLILVSTIMHFNGIRLIRATDDLGPGISNGRGLFQFSCILSHSCRPNCILSFSPDCQQAIIRAKQDIPAFEELTISYMDETHLLAPKNVRREWLLQHKEFLCCCERCSRAGDDMCIFPCPHSNCSGVLEAEASRDGTTEWSACGVCKALPTEIHQQEFQKHSSALARQLEFCKASRNWSKFRFVFFCALVVLAFLKWCPRKKLSRKFRFCKPVRFPVLCRGLETALSILKWCSGKKTLLWYVFWALFCLLLMFNLKQHVALFKLGTSTRQSIKLALEIKLDMFFPGGLGLDRKALAKPSVPNAIVMFLVSPGCWICILAACSFALGMPTPDICVIVVACCCQDNIACLMRPLLFSSSICSQHHLVQEHASTAMEYFCRTGDSLSEAEVLYVKLICEEAVLGRSLSAAVHHVRLAELHSRMGDKEKMLQCYRSAYEMVKCIMGDTHPYSNAIAQQFQEVHAESRQASKVKTS